MQTGSWLQTIASRKSGRCGLLALSWFSSCHLPLYVHHCLCPSWPPSYTMTFLTTCRNFLIPAPAFIFCFHFKYKDLIISISRFICSFQYILQSPGCLSHKWACVILLGPVLPFFWILISSWHLFGELKNILIILSTENRFHLHP